MLGDALKEENLAMSVIKSCEKKLTNRVVQDLFGKAPSPQTLVASLKGNPFEDLLVASGEGGEDGYDDDDGDLDASFLALRPDT